MSHSHVKNRRKRSGFTLVELLVVVAIIALLISILLPSLSKAREAARAVGCSSNMKQFVIANQLYADEEDGYFVPIKTAHPSWTSWMYIDKFRAIMDWRPSGPIPDALQCPDRPELYAEPQMWGIGYGFNRSNLGVAYGDANVVHRESVRYGAEKTQFGESNYWRYTWGSADFGTRWDPFGELMPAEGGTYPTIAYRHNEGTNWQFFDGHVEWVSKEESWGDSATDRIQMHYVYED